MITHLLSPGVVQTLAGIAPDSIQGMAFAKIQNALIGIIAGVIGATCYNKFKNTRLPDWLAFFSGKRCVAIVTALFSVIAAAILLFVWPIVFGGLTALGQSIAKMGAVGAGLYAFLNRLLIPFGLHHALNNVFWFDTIGLGDLSHFWAGDTSANVSWSLGMYMSGFFPCMKMCIRDSVYTNHGKLNLFNQKYELDHRPIEEGCQCPACRSYSLSLIHISPCCGCSTL